MTFPNLSRDDNKKKSTEPSRWTSLSEPARSNRKVIGSHNHLVHSFLFKAVVMVRMLVEQIVALHGLSRQVPVSADGTLVVTERFPSAAAVAPADVVPNLCLGLKAGLSRGTGRGVVILINHNVML